MQHRRRRQWNLPADGGHHLRAGHPHGRRTQRLLLHLGDDLDQPGDSGGEAPLYLQCPYRRGNRLHLRGASGRASAGGVGCARPPQEPGNPHSRRGEPHRDAEGGGSGRLPGGRAGPDHHGRPRRARRPGLPRYRDGGGIPAGRLPVRTAPEHTGPFQRGLSEHGRPGRRSHHLEDNRVLRRPQRPGAPGPAGGKAGTGRVPPVLGSVGQPRQRLREGGASQREPRPSTPMASSTTRPTRTAPTSSRSGKAFPGGPRDRPCR